MEPVLSSIEWGHNVFEQPTATRYRWSSSWAFNATQGQGHNKTMFKLSEIWNVKTSVEIEFYMNPFKASDSMFMERRSLMQVCILNLTKMDKIYIAKILICFDLNLVDFHETN